MLCINYSLTPDAAALRDFDFSILSPNARAEVAARKIPLLGKNDIWQSEFADVSQPAWADFVVNTLAARAAQQGFGGFFLDTADSVELLEKQFPLCGTTFLNRRWADDTEGALGVQTTWSSRWITDLWAGGCQNGFLGGARDGLLLNSLDSRQHRLSLAGNYLVAERFQTYGALTGREVIVDSEELALGWQANWGVEFLARRESPEFKLGYRGAYHGNSRKTGNLALVAPALAPGLTIPQQTQVLNSLVLPWLHREGISADLRDRLWGPLFYHVPGSADYAFERDSMEFGGRVGLTFQPRKSLEFGAELAYTTSAATTDGGSDLWEVGLWCGGGFEIP